MLALAVTFTNVSFHLVMGLYYMFTGWIPAIAGDLEGVETLNFTDFAYNIGQMIETENFGLTENAIFLVFLFFAFLSFFGMFLGMLLVPIGIFIELYVYAAFSPIPIATLFTGQRQVGIAFIKLIISVALRGVLVSFGIRLALAIISAEALWTEIKYSKSCPSRTQSCRQ